MLSEQPKNKRRSRHDANNRDYICPCGKSYLSYPALYTHVKYKHDGKPPGDITKPGNQKVGKRGRPKIHDVSASQSIAPDQAFEALTMLLDYVGSIESSTGELNDKTTQIYLKDPLYETYKNFPPVPLQSNDSSNIFEESCEYVLAEFMFEVKQKSGQSYYCDLIFLFTAMVGRILRNINNQPRQLSCEPIQNIVKYINEILLTGFPQFRKEEQQYLSGLKLFEQKQMGKILSFFFNWLTQKKYLNVRVKLNQQVFQD